VAGWGRVARYGEVLRGGTGSRAVGRAWSGCGGAPLQRARAGRAAGALRARCSAPARRQLLAAGGAPGLVWGRRRRHGRSRPSQHAHAPTTSGRGAVPGRSVEGPTRKRVCCAIQLGARCPPRPVTARWVSARFLSSSSLIGIDSSAPPAALVAPAPSGRGPPALLAPSSLALLRTDTRPSALLAAAPLAPVLTDARPPALLAPDPSARC